MADNARRKAISSNFRKYPPVLTVKQLCEILGLGTTKVYALVKAGDLPRIEKTGRHIHVLKEDVITFLIAHKNDG